jgi:hypothetical protein
MEEECRLWDAEGGKSSRTVACPEGQIIHEDPAPNNAETTPRNVGAQRLLARD